MSVFKKHWTGISVTANSWQQKTVFDLLDAFLELQKLSFEKEKDHYDDRNPIY